MSFRVGWMVDGVVGKMSRLLYALRGAEHDTLGDLGPYLDRPAAELFPAPTREPIAKRRRSLRSLTRTSETVSFESEHVPLCPRYAERHRVDYPENHTAWLRWIHPLGRVRKSILIHVHGWLEPGAWLDEALLFPSMYKQLHVDLAHVQLPFHGHRKPKGSYFHGEYYWSADLVRTMEAVRQSVIDLRSAMLFFRAQGYEQIGVSGISLGGSITMIAACVAPVPEYIVPIIAHLDVGDAVENAPILWRMKADLERFGLDEPKRRAILARTGLAGLAPILPRERQLWVAARDDMYIDARGVERQWQAWNRPPILWIGGGHMTFPMAVPKIISSIAEFRNGLPETPERRTLA